MNFYIRRQHIDKARKTLQLPEGTACDGDGDADKSIAYASVHPICLYCPVALALGAVVLPHLTVIVEPEWIGIRDNVGNVVATLVGDDGDTSSSVCDESGDWDHWDESSLEVFVTDFDTGKPTLPTIIPLTELMSGETVFPSVINYPAWEAQKLAFERETA